MRLRTYLYILLVLSFGHIGANDLITSIKVRPEKVVLVSEVPEELHILSLSNSLTAFSRQDELFVNMAKSVGISAEWTAHNIIGRPLSSHWQEGPLLNADGLPGAQQLVRSYPWTHIILQDHSQLPMYSQDTFYANIEQWVDYIRRECPNPNVSIILPMNWAYVTMWNTYDSITDVLHESYREVAYRIAGSVCPIGEAYRQMLHTQGEDMTQNLFIDERHPSGLAGYMAAAMELSMMTGIKPTDINWCPDTIDAAQALIVRKIGEDVLSSYDNVVDYQKGHVNFTVQATNADGEHTDVTRLAKWSVDGVGEMQGNTFISHQQEGEAFVDAQVVKLHGQAEVEIVKPSFPLLPEMPFIPITDEANVVTEDFNSMAGDITLPTGWRVDAQILAYGCVGHYEMAADTVEFTGGENISMNELGWTACFEASSEIADCAIGGLATSFSRRPVGINVYARFVNKGQMPACHFELVYDVEKYKRGSNPLGTQMKMFYSFDGKSWMSAGEGFTAHWDADAFNSGEPLVPIDTRHIAHHLHGIELEPGQELYLAWNIGPSGPGTANRTMALGIDNVSLSFSHRGVGVETVHASCDSMRIEGDALAGNGRIEVFDLQGRLVVAGRQLVSLDGLPPGVYVAHDQAGHSLKVRR